MYAYVVTLLALALITGCSATGPLYTDHTKTIGAPATSKARLVVFRTQESMQGSARSVSVKVDGVEVGSCDYAGFNIFDINPGNYMLTVGLDDIPGSCSLPIDVGGGSENYFEITPRPESIGSGLFLGVVGQAIESAGKQCGGAVAVGAIARDLAIAKLSSLRKTE